MIQTITPGEMKAYETLVMAHTTITSEWLMQNAAQAVADEVLSRQNLHTVLVFCGCGNNGADGMAALRKILVANPQIQGICVLLPGRLSVDAQREAEALQKVGERLQFLPWTEYVSMPAETPDLVIDALFGTGLSRSISGEAAEAVGRVNLFHEEGSFVIAVDIPSGLNGETGEVLGSAVFADVTITFHRPKPGFYLQAGPNHTGDIRVADIGLRQPACEAFPEPPGWHILSKEDIQRLLPKRKPVSNKGSYGKLLLWVGSFGMAGAAAICATAALRTGAGLVTVACPEKMVPIVQILCPCATCLPLPENATRASELLCAALHKCDAFGLGCGLGQSEDTAAILKEVLRELSIQNKLAVVDADALNLISQMEIPLPEGRFFLTPHPGEAARLLHCDVARVTATAPDCALRLADTYGAAVVLKGTASLIVAGGERFISPYGTPGMAKGGSGDALTGVVAALLAGRAAGAYTMTDGELLACACGLHGLSGEAAAQTCGQRGMLATDLCNQLGLLE